MSCIRNQPRKGNLCNPDGWSGGRKSAHGTWQMAWRPREASFTPFWKRLWAIITCVPDGSQARSCQGWGHMVLPSPASNPCYSSRPSLSRKYFCLRQMKWCLQSHNLLRATLPSSILVFSMWCRFLSRIHQSLSITSLLPYLIPFSGHCISLCLQPHFDCG